jgi:hypothetical protein
MLPDCANSPSVIHSPCPPSCPSSAGEALTLPFASPTEYGLGRSGWVTGRFPRGACLPFAVLKLWIDESYRAVAPKRLAAQLEGKTVFLR